MTVSVDGELVIDTLLGGQTSTKEIVKIEPGISRIRVDFSENIGNAKAKLNWRPSV